MKESIFNILRDLIHERVGLYYENSKREMLADKLYPRLVECGLDSFLDYYYFLKYDESSINEWQLMMNALSVPETFFWREFDQINTLVTTLLPNYQNWLLEQGKLNPACPFLCSPIKIWSAACSTGEEPLTLAMALNEAGWFEKLPIHIYASDASPRAITIAKTGIYRERSFRSLPLHLKNKYFTNCAEGWQINPEIKQKVHWQTANLFKTSEIEFLARSPFIFCRNVFIYFSADAIAKTAKFFYQEMPTPSYLFISASESLLKLNTGFDLQEIGGAFIYVKT